MAGSRKRAHFGLAEAVSTVFASLSDSDDENIDLGIELT
jgi:hypothetical protein